MPLNATRLREFRQETVQRYGKKDSLFYALSIGIGRDPLDPRQLRFVYEKDQLAFPTMAHVIAMEPNWMQDPINGVNIEALLHMESALVMTRALPSSGKIMARNCIPAVYDRGVGRGALVLFQRTLFDAETGAELAEVTETFLLRANGGFGGAPPPSRSRFVAPERPADFLILRPTLPQTALLYRLVRDDNPLHADPVVAAAAGFERPILHGACTQAIIADSLIEHLCDYDPRRLSAIDVRFAAPFFPGATLRIEVWAEKSGGVIFQASDHASGQVVVTGASVFRKPDN